jgi:tetratricopeptide (TPR) repeat protein
MGVVTGRVRRLIFVSFVAAAGCASAPKPAAMPPPTPVAHEEEMPMAHEHGAAEAPAAPALTLAKLAESALLFDDLGSYHRTISSKSAEAQKFFDQGLRLVYGFNHDEATRSFAKAAALDPTCAMCFWGASLTLGPNYNVPMLPDRSVMAWEALEKARALAPASTPVEQALIGALAKRYKGPEPLDPPAMQPFNEAYAAAMRDVARQFPDDADVQVLFAESMMDVNPWKLWSLDGKPAPGTDEIVATLEKVIEKHPEHPGANHYYIHAVEAAHPEKAVAAADRLGPMMPGAGHLVHMPAHIYQRVGRYADASEANRKAAVADLAYMKKLAPWGYYPMYLGHNYGFLAYSSAMEGRAAESLAAAREATKAMPPGMIDMMPGMDFFVAEPLLVMVRFGKWDELLAEPRPDAKYQVLSGFWLHGHGMALAAKGQLDDADKDLAALVALSGQVAPDLIAGQNAAKDVLVLAAKVLEARLAEKRGKPEALALWADAVALEDRMAYSEPADWFYPVRHFQGAALLAAKKWKDAEAVFRADLVRNPDKGWAYFGLAQALRGEKKTKDAAKAEAQWKKAWPKADVTLTSSTAF